MKRISALLVAIVFSVAACNFDSPSSSVQRSDGAAPAAEGFAGVGLPGHGTILRVVGTATAYDGKVPDIDGDGVEDDALCFDIDLYDASGTKVGTATDCLSDIGEVGDGLALIGTTIFRLANGTFIARGHTTVQPLTTTSASPVTHTTGAVPMPGTNGVIHGTGAFKNFQAEVRLGGAVNLSRLGSDNEITFDCLFSVLPQ
jgi:hypothetical protein